MRVNPDDRQLRNLFRGQREDDLRRAPVFRRLLARERPSLRRARWAPALAGLAGAAALVLVAVCVDQLTSGPSRLDEHTVVAEPPASDSMGDRRVFKRSPWSSKTDFLLTSSPRDLLAAEPVRPSALDLAVLPDLSTSWTASRIDLPSIERPWRSDRLRGRRGSNSSTDPLTLNIQPRSQS